MGVPPFVVVAVKFTESPVQIWLALSEIATLAVTDNRVTMVAVLSTMVDVGLIVGGKKDILNANGPNMESAGLVTTVVVVLS